MTNEIDTDVITYTLRKLVSAKLADRKIQEHAEDPLFSDSSLWTELVEGGWTAIGIPEVAGGAGGTLAELAVVVTELGRGLASVPLMTNACACACLTASDPGLACLESIASGESVATFAESPTVNLTRSKTYWSATGTTGPVLDAAGADLIVLSCSTTDGVPAVALVRSTDVHIEPVLLNDLSRRAATLTFDDAPAELVALGNRAIAGRAAAQALGALLVSADSVGLAERALEETLTYVKQRVQFDRPIGAFQAVKHRCADMFVRIEAAKALLEDACSGTAVAADHHRVSIAKPYCTSASIAVAEAAIQLHGGIGFTWEHDAHLWLRRATLNDSLFGDARTHRRHAGVELARRATKVQESGSAAGRKRREA